MMPTSYLNIHTNMKMIYNDCIGILVPWLVNYDQSDCSIGGFFSSKTPPRRFFFKQTLFSEAIALNSE